MARDGGVSIAAENPYYWTYDGEPTLLLGGSSEDNLFQVPGVERELDDLVDAGGNYVRCTMSSRDEGDVWPFEQVDDGTYDLDGWNDEYWDRFGRFLRATAERDVVVQVEVWATFDYYGDPWDENPFNPEHNVTYTAEESGLPTVVETTPKHVENDFFRAVPAELDLETVLAYQERFVDELLSHALDHDHVLYCMDNETNASPAWSAYWAEYVAERAAEQGTSAYTTEMWRAGDPTDPRHDETLDRPDRYDFADVSQNNHRTGQTHYDNFLVHYDRVDEDPRPLTNVKIYGGYGRFGSERDGAERFWRNVFAGAATARFHRPGSGLGLNATARRMIRSARDVTDVIDVHRCEPRPDLLDDAGPNEAFALADPARMYAVYFPDGGDARLNLSGTAGSLTLRWYDVERCRWHGRSEVGGDDVHLESPGSAQWVAVIE